MKWSTSQILPVYLIFPLNIPRCRLRPGGIYWGKNKTEENEQNAFIYF